MKEKPRPGSEAAAKAKNDRWFCLAATFVSIILFLTCYSNFLPSYFHDWHVAALVRGGWNDVASIGGIILFLIGPVIVWLGASDVFPAWIGQWIPTPWLLYLVSLAGGISLAAGFRFDL